MYQLVVFCPNKLGLHETINVAYASEVLELIPNILAEHHGSEHVVVMFGHVRLFAVDREGNRLP